MKLLWIDYTIYSYDHVPSRDSQGRPQEGSGECLDCPTMRAAKRKAKQLGVGSIIVRNFNLPLHLKRSNIWWQTDFCWIWNGVKFSKALPMVEKKWIVTDTWKQAKTLADFRRGKI